MANKETATLTAADALTGTELVHVVQGGNSRKALLSAIAALALAGLDTSSFVLSAQWSSAAEVTIASSATTDVLGGASLYALVSGTTQITSFGTGTNRLRVIRFSAAVEVVHHATNLIIPGGANRTTAAGEVWVIKSDASSAVRVVSISRADGKSVIAPAFSDLTGKPTTIAGYGITDAYTKTEQDVTDAALTASIAANPFIARLLHVRDQKASTTAGGTFTSGAWRTRTLNTALTSEISGASLGSNQITLPAGTYWFEAEAPAEECDLNQLRLYNITDGSTILVGQSMRCQGNDAGDVTGGIATICGRFTLAAQKVVELQHRCSTTQATNGFGRPNSFGEVEVYADVRIWKIG